ncbi:E3 ubiquitin-protein ligase RNF217-like [Salvelinus sp. IW2-2015]|uniref:E3 ubiquitin-protein ligase RNF217-like n=1 Tax=Salvelinus sp. IW2-2015 TaxID=2691554 RepID=UPI000CDF9C22|nr:probable E3 ubiquitin-protein ligase RNF217 [Salvelinus alpinus]
MRCYFTVRAGARTGCMKSNSYNVTDLFSPTRSPGSRNIPYLGFVLFVSVWSWRRGRACMGSCTLGMEDEHISLNVCTCKMPSFVSRYDEETVCNPAEILDKVETSGTDFIQDVRETKIQTPDGDGILETHTHRVERTGSKENVEGYSFRKPTAVDILRRNFGTTRSPTNFKNNSADDQKHPEDAMVEIVLNERIDHVDLEKSSGSETNVKEQIADHTEGLTSSDLNEVDVTDSDDICERSRADDDVVQLKEHVYCTVYCIANDNYRKPADNTGEHQYNGAISPSTSNVITKSSTDLRQQSNLEMGHHTVSDPYTLPNLIDPRTLSNFYNGDYNESVVLACRICLEDTHIKPLFCCKKAVCEECLKIYIISQVRVGRTNIVCPITECSGYLEESLLVSHLGSEEVAKYKYFLELSQIDSSTKPCPQCSQFTSLKGHTPSRAEHKYKIQCTKCQFVWCFKCHAPWHEDLKCRDYRKGDKLLRHWASIIEHGQRNAQKCPHCKIHIQRTEGCDHMNCTQCSTNFCYRCGEKYRHLRFFGDHTSNLSVFGCKYRYLPEKPHLRRLVRGSVCVSKVVVAPVVIALVVVVGAVSMVIGLVAFPIFYICKKRRQRTQCTGRWH